MRVSETPVIDFPFIAGQWRVLVPPGHPPFAMDFLGTRYQRYLKSESMWRHMTRGVDTNEFIGWGQGVHSPVSGKVVLASDGWSDREKAWLPWDILRVMILYPRNAGDDLRPHVGNHLAIESDIGVVHLAHLRCRSIVVSQGQTVHAGQLIAQLGNSGNTMGPHLHLHMTDGADPLRAKFIPFRFASYEHYCGGESWATVRDSVPIRRSLVRALGEHSLAFRSELA